MSNPFMTDIYTRLLYVDTLFDHTWIGWNDLFSWIKEVLLLYYKDLLITSIMNM